MERLFAKLYYKDAPDASTVEPTEEAFDLEMRSWAKALFETDNEYLQRRTEVFARTFEKWIQMEVQQEFGRTNRFSTKSERLYDLSQYPPSGVVEEVRGLLHGIVMYALAARDVVRENPDWEPPRKNEKPSDLGGVPQFEDLPDECALVNYNEQRDGIEIYFAGPQDRSRTKPLREGPFLFSPEGEDGRAYWFAKYTEERWETAKEVVNDCPTSFAFGEGEDPPSDLKTGGRDVFEVPIEDVKTDPERFQPRGGDYSEKTASGIVEDFKPELMDPIDLWRDSEDGKLYVLAGQSRLEGFKRRDDKDTIPAEIKKLDEEQAIKYALIENESGTDLTPSERAGVLRDIVDADGIDTISGRKEKAKELFGKAGNEVFALSYLSPTGAVMDNLRRFEGTSSTDADDVLQMAKWIGKIRRFNRGLSDLHERNLWDFLRDNFKSEGKGFTSFVEFRKFIENVIQRQFFPEGPDPETPLNLERVQPKSQQEEKIDRLIREKREELREHQKELESKREELIERGAEGDALERGLEDLQETVNATQQELIDLRERAKRERGRLKQQEQGLFDSARANPPTWVHFGRTEGLDVVDEDGDTLEFRFREGKEGHLFSAVGMDQLILVPPSRVDVDEPKPHEEAEEAFETFHNFEPGERPGGEKDLIFELPGGDPELLGGAKTIYYRSDKVMRPGDAPGDDHDYYHYFEDGHAVEKLGSCLVIASCLGEILPDGYRCKEVEVDERGILN